MVLRILPRVFRLRVRGFHPLRPAFPKLFCCPPTSLMQSITPECTHSGLASFPFARRYSGNRCFFLFLRLLRCFSSPGSPPYVMDWRMDDWSFSSRVSPFRHPWITGYLLLPTAFRSLSRLSSALSAKASALRPSLFDHLFSPVYSVIPAVLTVLYGFPFLQLFLSCLLLVFRCRLTFKIFKI